jgi:tripartite-type tricarboxylate transporter receptor subunit TctC
MTLTRPMRKIRRGVRATFALLAVAIAGLIAIAPARAQSYPSKTVHFIVPFAPGGSSDRIARILATKLSESFGQQVVVENRFAGGGQLGVEMTVNAQPDGHTLLVTPNGPVSITRHARKLPYGTATDLAPVSMLATIPAGIAVSNALPVQTLAEFVNYAKERPGQLNYAIPTIGTHMHLAGELLKLAAGINIVAVPYKGTGPATAALVSGEVHAGISDLASLLAFARRGAIRILAVADPKRSITAPDIPTAAEAGVPRFGVTAWVAMFAPARTPPAIIARVNNEVTRALSLADVREFLIKTGIEPAPSTPQAMGRMLREQIDDFGMVIQGANIKFE